MKRFLSAVVLCLGLLVTVSFIVVHRTKAQQEDIIMLLLKMPAPPPPNPLMPIQRRSEKFYSKLTPPPDDAPIEDLLEYWARRNVDFADLRYRPTPSDKTIGRLLDEIESDPSLLPRYMKIMADSPRAVDTIRRIYDSGVDIANSDEYDGRSEVREWLKNNSSHFSADLERIAGRAKETGEYVTNQDELLSLARVDWDRARPIVDQLYRSGDTPVSQVLARWALYKHAITTDSIDIDRYRDELKSVVEDKKAMPGARDLAMDALVAEREWGSRDDWYFSLLSDETLAEVRVNGSVYTGLTTLILNSPEDKYVDKMIEFTKSDNPVVRGAAARNLLLVVSAERPQVTRALLPWLENEKWVNISNEQNRQAIVNSLASVKMPEAVPALIAALDQKQVQEAHLPPGYDPNDRAASRAAWAANAVANAAATAANSVSYARSDVVVSNANANAAAIRMTKITTYPLRRNAIDALAFQADMRAAPALRRMLPLVEDWERRTVVNALIACKGFSVEDQVNALEEWVRYSVANPSMTATAANAAANASYASPKYDTASLIASALLSTRTVSDDLVAATASRIVALEKSDPLISAALRAVMAFWDGPAVHALLLRDLRLGKVGPDGIVKLLANRKEIGEKLPSAVYELRTGMPIGVGTSACMTDSENDYAAILAGENLESKAAMLACARLIRGRVPVDGVVRLMKSPDKRLAAAAERYLESEDSPEARAAVLAAHPGEAKILGATTAFIPDGLGAEYVGFGADASTLALFASVNDYFANRGYFHHAPLESVKNKELRDELSMDSELLGVYSYDHNFIRIYKNRAVFSWEEDASRYRERTLEQSEFDSLKGFLAHNRVDELAPFLGCFEDRGMPCDSKELVMVGRNGGRRVFWKAHRKPAFFASLESIIADMKRPPAKLNYWLAKSIPGLEILFADENLTAVTVWKNGGDMRLLVADKVRQKVGEKQVEVQIEALTNYDENEEEIESEETRAKAYKIRKQNEFDGLGWFSYSSGRLGDATVQPPDVEAIPIRDAISPPAGQNAWKARAPGVEVRSDDTGLYKITAGKSVKMRDGFYSSALITPNGRWAIASKYVEGEGANLVRVDLTTGKEYEVKTELEGMETAIAYVPAIGRVLLSYPVELYDHHGYGPSDSSPIAGWLDPVTGRVTPAAGELRPLMQQNIRSLQPAAAAGEYWAAIPDRRNSETIIGIYNSRTQKFSQRLKLPKIEFDSMAMWVDESEGKAYFVYEGHLLVVPLSGQNPAVAAPRSN